MHWRGRGRNGCLATAVAMGGGPPRLPRAGDLLALASALLLPAALAQGQVTEAGATHASAALPEERVGWSFSAEVYGFLVPDDQDFANPTVSADREWLHLEARYNYEALQTGSLFAGWNFHFGDALSVDVTPMVGGTFGNLRGIAPAYELAVEYKAFALSSQSEYVFDLSDRSGDFFYNWSEATWSPWSWMHAGLAIQRTRTYTTGLELQRGPVLWFTYRKASIGVYVFNLGWESPTTVLAGAYDF